MLVDGRDERFLFALQRVPYGIARCGRTGIIVVSPCEATFGLHVAGKVHHVIVAHRADLFQGEHSVHTVEVGITARSSFFGIASHVAQRRMVGSTKRDALVKTCGNNSQCTSLRTSLNSHIPTVPFGQRRQQVNTTHACQIDTLHIVVVAVVEPLAEIAVGVCIEGAADFVKLLSAHARVQSVDFHFQTDESVFGIILVAQRLLDSLYPGSWRTKHHGATSLLRILRIE